MTLRTLCGWCLVLCTAAVWAQDSKETSTKEQAPAAQTLPTTASEEAPDDEEEDDGNFLPTEKINVDSSVSFPVDI